MKITLVPLCCSVVGFLYFCLDLHVVAVSDPDIGVANGNPDYASLFLNLDEDFTNSELGCTDPSGPVDVYTWRPAGYGSNINNMMLPWVHALALGRRDLALVLAKGKEKNRSGFFDLVTCVMESNGAEDISGFSCLFAAMPHLCIFQQNEDWERFMIERNLSIAAREDALRRRDVMSDQEMVPKIVNYLKDSSIDIISSMAIVLDYLHSHWQPWLKRDIQSILDEPATAAIREVPYIGIHVRRGDKLIREAEAHDVKEYLEAARSYIMNPMGVNPVGVNVSVEDIRGIWVSSDDNSVLSDVKQAYAEFFPNVELERILRISNHTLTNDLKTSEVDVPQDTRTMHYGSYVVFFAELTALTESSVFVGTFSSNVGRLMVLLREAKGLPRTSAISVDNPTWHPGRRALLTH